MKKLLCFMAFVWYFSSSLWGQDCALTNVGPFCYSVTSQIEVFAVDLCPDNPTDLITVTIDSGQVENSYDEYEVLSIDPGVDTTLVYQGYGNAGDLTGLSITADGLGECLTLQINSDISATCSSSGYTPIYYSTSCAPADPAPTCGINITPANGTADVRPVDVPITFDLPATATNYYFMFGTDPGNLDTLFAGVNDADTISVFPDAPNYDVTYFWQVIPFNISGAASGCDIWRFTTIAIQDPPDMSGASCSAGLFGAFYSETFSSTLPAGWTGALGTGITANLWNTQTGATGTSGTGPSGAFEGSHYLYWESSTGADTSACITPAIDLTANTDAAELEFYIHMFGSGMGTMIIEASADTAGGGTWTTLGTLTGPHQETETDPWKVARYDLTSFNGGNVYIRFTAQLYDSGPTFFSDMAIDFVSVRTCVPCPAPTLTTVSSETGNGATFSWNDPGTGAFEVVVDTPGFTPDGSAALSIASNTLDWSGGTSNTAYEYYVRSDCGADSSMWVGPIAFATLCSEVADYCDEFDAESTGQFNANRIACWINTQSVNPEWTIGTGGTTSGSTGPSGAVVGANYVFLETSSPATEGQSDTLTGPPVDIAGLTVPRLAYQIHMYGQSMGTLRTELSDDGGSTWNLIDNVVGQQQTASTDAWIPKAFDLSSYGNEVIVRFIGIRGSDFYSDMAIDGICIEESPSCPEPILTSVSNIGADGALFTWSDPGTGNFVVVVDTAGFTPSGATAIAVADTFYAWSGGMSNTNYEYYVRSACGGDSSAWAGPVAFSTLCSEVADYCDEFDAVTPAQFNGGLIACWSNTNSTNPEWTVGTGTTTSSGTGPSGAVDGTNYVFLETSSPATTGQADTLTGPTVDVSGLTTPRLTYAIHMYGQSMGTLRTEVSDDNGGTWALLDTVVGQQQTATTDPWIEKEFDLSSYGDDVIVRFIGIRGNDFYSDMAIDKICIEETPTCPEPTSLLAEYIGSDSVKLSWNGGGSGTDWIYDWVPSGSMPGSANSTTTTVDSAIVTGLALGSAYDFYVREVCSSGDSSAWVGPSSLITPQVNYVCEGAISLNCDDMVVDSNIFTLPGTYATCVTNPGTYGLWYVISGNNEQITVSTVDAVTNFDTKLNVYTNDCDSRVCVGGNDDATGSQSEYSFFASVGMDYYVYVSGFASAQGTFKLSVSCDPCFDPTNLTVSEVTTNSADISWDANPNATGFVIEYGFDGFALGTGTQVTTGAAGGPITLSPLMPDSTYDVYLYEICGGSNSDTLSSGFTVLPSCPNATGLAVDNITSDGATLSWSSYITTGTWVVEYGEDGFTLGTGTEVLVNDTFYAVSGLMPTTDYDAYVRVICSAGDSSALYVGPVSFTTECGVYTPDYLDSFNTFLPECWSEARGGTASDGPATYGIADWISEAFGNDAASPNGTAARLNAWQTESEWLLTPMFDLSGGDHNLIFDMAATEYNNTSQAVWADADTMYLVYTTDGTSWMTLDKWSSGNIPSATGDSLTYDLSSISSTSVQFGFYYSTFGSDSPEDIEIYIDNFEILTQSSPCPPVLNITDPVAGETYHGDVVNATGAIVTPNAVNISYETELNLTEFEVELGAELTTSQLDCP